MEGEFLEWKPMLAGTSSVSKCVNDSVRVQLVNVGYAKGYQYNIGCIF
jgi:hypothetical protein